MTIAARGDHEVPEGHLAHLGLQAPEEITIPMVITHTRPPDTGPLTIPTTDITSIMVTTATTVTMVIATMRRGIIDPITIYCRKWISPTLWKGFLPV